MLPLVEYYLRFKSNILRNILNMNIPQSIAVLWYKQRELFFCENKRLANI